MTADLMSVVLSSSMQMHHVSMDGNGTPTLPNPGATTPAVVWSSPSGTVEYINSTSNDNSGSYGVLLVFLVGLVLGIWLMHKRKGDEPDIVIRSRRRD